MKEYKLVPLNEMNVTTSDVSPSQTSDGVKESPKVGGQQDNILNQILNNNQLDTHFKLLLLNHLTQKMDNKILPNPQNTKEEDKLVVNSNLFEIIKHYIQPLDIPNAYRMFTYFVEKNDVRWDDNGVIYVNNNKINLDIYKLFKYLTSRNMRVRNEDRTDLTRLLYSAHSIKPFIKNSHIIKMMEGEVVDDGINDTKNVRRGDPIQTRHHKRRKLLGDGVWFRW